MNEDNLQINNRTNEPENERKIKFSELKLKYKKPFIVVSGIFLLLGLIISSWYLLIGNSVQEANKSGQILRLSLSAARIDSGGVKPDSGFLLRSNVSLSESDIKKIIKFKPDVGYTVKTIPKVFSFLNFAHAQDQNATGSQDIYEIKPETNLDPGKIYQIYTATSSDVQVDHNYSWAFQIKAPFQVSSVFPADKATDVPINSGIEISFNHDGIKDISQYFSIEPAVKGKFEKYSDRFVFVPENLASSTIYKVIVKKELKAGGSDDQLADDYVFSFETAGGPTQGDYKYFNWNDDLIYFTPDKNPTLEVNTNYSSGIGVLTVYKFSSADNFVKSYLDNKNDPLRC
jgi:hypothetical protein